MSDNDESRPDGSEEDTAPLRPSGEAPGPPQRPAPPYAPPAQPYAQPAPPYVQPQRPAPPYLPQQPFGPPYPPGPASTASHQHQYTRPLPPPGYGYPGTPRAGGGPTVPGWVWPLVAAVALVVGLVGGTLGGVAVSASMDNGSPGPTIVGAQGDGEVTRVDPEKGSVAAVAQAVLPSTVQVIAQIEGERGTGTSTGSGFVLDNKAHIITNNHVVNNAVGGQIEVIDNDGDHHAAEIVGRSEVYDVAVLRIEDGAGLPPVSLGSSEAMNVGETVVSLGSPLGLDSTVTSGIVSALDRPVTAGDKQGAATYINAVQTDAAINPGSSGGPLVNLRGEVIGMNSAIATVGSMGGEAGNIGVGFAIPIEQVQQTAVQILRTGEAEYPVIGANVSISRTNRGATIVEVPDGTPADQAGLREDDVVVAVGDVEVTDGIGLIVAIRAHRPGETVDLRVQRGGQTRTVRVTLGSKVG